LEDSELAVSVTRNVIKKVKQQSAINDLLKVMAKLRSSKGCPWDHEQTHLTLRRHAIEEVYELVDAIEAHDDQEMAEELGDLLLQAGLCTSQRRGENRWI
jgi:tetrapyrrole methylase family protein / MazG family protein